MDKWIESLNDRAKKEIQPFFLSEAYLYERDYVHYDPATPNEIELMGDFTLDQLISLVGHMQSQNKGE